MNAAMMDAVKQGDLPGARACLQPGDVNRADPQGMTALMWAARAGRLDLAAWLLACGADVHAGDERGLSALFHACHNPDDDRGHPDMVRLLLQHGADVEVAIGFGVRPLMFAAGNGEAGVVQALLDGGADPLARNEFGRTALMMVKDRDYVDVINILHEAESLREAGHCGTRNAPDQQVVTFLKPAQRP
jgi:ankyrin repeat protein